MVAFFAIFTITRRNPVTAVMSLVATFFGLAGIYATLSAHFLAVLQVLVYAGAIMVLFIFVVMILNREEVAPVSFAVSTARRWASLAGVLSLSAVHRGRWTSPDRRRRRRPRRRTTFGTVAAVGDICCSATSSIPFEAISLLLLVAIVGGVVVSRSHQKEVAADARRRLPQAIDELASHDYPARPRRSRRPTAHGHAEVTTACRRTYYLDPLVHPVPDRDGGRAAAPERADRAHGRSSCSSTAATWPCSPSRARWATEGARLRLLVIALAAAEAAVGLAILVGLFRSRQTVNLDEATLMKR